MRQLASLLRHLLDEASLDRSVAYLQSIGRRAYLVLDASEVEAFRQRFGRSSRLGALDWSPFATLATPFVAVYDLLDRGAVEAPLAIGVGAGRRGWWRCDRPQRWPTPLRME